MTEAHSCKNKIRCFLQISQLFWGSTVPNFERIPMPRKYTLLWDKVNKSWFQFYKCPSTGKRRKKYLGRGTSKTNDNSSYIKAVQNWKAFTSTLANPPTSPKKRQQRRSGKVSYDKHTVSGLIDHYLFNYSVGQVQQGFIAPSTYENRRRTLLQWKETFLGPKAYATKEDGWGPDKVLNSVRLNGYHKYLLRASLRDQTIGFQTARLRMSLVKQFFYWCFQTDKIEELPRNINSPMLHMRRPRHMRDIERDENVQIMSNEDISSLFAAISQYRGPYPLGLYVLLSLNTGMNMGDITELRWGHIITNSNLEPHRIIKRRRKTNVKGEWSLWEITRHYLIEHLRSVYQCSLESLTDETIIFPLLDYATKKALSRTTDTSTLDLSAAKPVFASNNTAQSQLNRMFKKASLTYRVKHLRKKAATTILELTDNNEVLTQAFLSHKPKTIALRHYADVSIDRLDDIVGEMYYSLGINHIEPRIYDEIQKYRRIHDARR